MAECNSGDVACFCSAAKRKESVDDLSSCIKKGCKLDEAIPTEDLSGPLCTEATGGNVFWPSYPIKRRAFTASDDVPLGGGEEPEQESSATSTDDTATSASIDPVKAGVAASESTASSLSEFITLMSVESSKASRTSAKEAQATDTGETMITLMSIESSTASSASTKEAEATDTGGTMITLMSTESSTVSSTSTKEAEATRTVVPASDGYLARGGLSAGAKAGIGVGVALGVIGLGCLVAAIWIVRQKRVATGASGKGVTHVISVRSLNPFSRQVEAAELDGRPAPQKLPA